jgi:cell division septum initiation protein DivIVA
MRDAKLDGYGYLVALLDEAADRTETLQADNARLLEEIARLRGPVTYYKKGYGPGDGYAAIQERSDET